MSDQGSGQGGADEIIKELLGIREQFQTNLRTLEMRQSAAIAQIVAALDARGRNGSDNEYHL